MGWKQDLAGRINTAISRRQNATIIVSSVEQKEWAERRIESAFSTLHLNVPIKIEFKVVEK